MFPQRIAEAGLKLFLETSTDSLPSSTPRAPMMPYSPPPVDIASSLANMFPQRIAEVGLKLFLDASTVSLPASPCRASAVTRRARLRSSPALLALQRKTSTLKTPRTGRVTSHTSCSAPSLGVQSSTDSAPPADYSSVRGGLASSVRQSQLSGMRRIPPHQSSGLGLPRSTMMSGVADMPVAGFGRSPKNAPGPRFGTLPVAFASGPVYETQIPRGSGSAGSVCPGGTPRRDPRRGSATEDVPDHPLFFEEPQACAPNVLPGPHYAMPKSLPNRHAYGDPSADKVAGGSPRFHFREPSADKVAEGSPRLLFRDEQVHAGSRSHYSVAQSARLLAAGQGAPSTSRGVSASAAGLRFSEALPAGLPSAGMGAPFVWWRTGIG